MSLLDGILTQIGGNADVKNLAARVGLTPEQVETAIHALGQAHPAPGDTVATAAAQTGLPPSVLTQIVGHLGGEGALGHFAGLLEQSSGMLGQLGSMTSGLFGKK